MGWRRKGMGGKTCEARLAKAKVEEQECWRRWGPEPE